MKRDKHASFFGDLYHRNETFLLLSAGIFLGSIVLGYLLSGMLDPILGNVLDELRKSVGEGSLQLSTFSIFMNNFKIALLIYAGGFVVGTYSVVSLFINGAFIGYTASKFSWGSFLIYTLPHGVFEIIAIILSGAAAFRLASGVVQFLKGVLKLNPNISIKNQLNYLVEANIDEFYESLTLFAIAVVLLLIAAFIEANLTIAWGNYIQSII